MSAPHVSLTTAPIDAATLARRLSQPAAGALATFEGVVRSETSRDGRRLVALEYSAHEAMALEQMADLCRRARHAFDVLEVAVAHRLGRLTLSEVSVAVAVAAAHRAGAFDACRWMIDALKTDVPIWKKEIWSDGMASWSDPLRADA